MKLCKKCFFVLGVLLTFYIGPVFAEAHRINNDVSRQQKTGKVEGKITRSDTNQPVLNASISLKNDEDASGANTDIQGKYSVDLRPGSYSLTLRLILGNLTNLPCPNAVKIKPPENMKGQMFVISGIDKEDRRILAVMFREDKVVVTSGKILRMDFAVSCGVGAL